MRLGVRNEHYGISRELAFSDFWAHVSCLGATFTCRDATGQGYG